MTRPFWRHFGATVLSVLSLFICCGCGSSSDAVPTQSTRSPTPLALAGELSLGRFVAGGSVGLETLEGETLLSSTIGPTGSFLLQPRQGQLPSDFRLRATFENSDLAFFLEVRGYSGEARFFRINVPTTLASLHMRNQPALSVEQANSEVGRALGIPQGTSFASLSESSRSPFSHLAFFVDAAAAGGWRAFSEQLLAEAASGARAQGANSGEGRFVARRDDLSASLDGLEDGLRQHAEFLQTYRPLVLSLGKGVIDILGEVGGDLYDSIVVSTATDVAWTNIAEHFGLNFGTTQALDKIQEQLQFALEQIEGIELALDDQDYSQATDQLASTVAYLQTLSLGNLSAAVSQADLEGLPSDTPVVEQPSTTGIGTLLDSVAVLKTATSLQLLSDYQLDGSQVPNMNLLWRRNKVDNVLAIDAQPRFMGFPIRSNAWLDLALQNYEYYRGYQSLGGKWLADNARQGTDPASDIPPAYDALDSLCTSLKAQRAQFPDHLMSDDVIVDLQNGVMWHVKVNGKMTQAEAKSYASSLSVEGQLLGQKISYTNWRLPTYEELKSLQDRGRFFAGGYDPSVPSNSNTGYGDTGQALAGLPGLGFVGVSEAFSDPDSGVKTSDGGMWFAAYGYTLINEFDPDPLGWEEFPYAELEFNRANKDPNYKSASDKRPFLVCRSLGDPLLDASAPGLTGATVPADDPFPDGLSASLSDIEYPSLGVPTGIDSIVDISLSQTATDITYSIYLGGEFKQGDSVTNASRSNPSRTQTATLKPYSGTVNASPRYNALILVPSYSTGQSVFQVSNFPPAFDGTGGQEGFQNALNTFGSSGFILKDTDSSDQQTTQLTATVYGYEQASDSFPVAIVKTGSIGQSGRYESGKTRQPAAYQVSPRNRVYDSASPQLQGKVAVEQYTSSLFFDNQTISSQTANATWSLLTQEGTPYTGDAATLSGGELRVDLTKVPRLGLTLQIQSVLPARNGWPQQTDIVKFRAVQEI